MTNITETILLDIRELRNAIEHFDERLDKFLSDFPVGYIFDALVDSHHLADDPLAKIFRLIDPAEEVFVLFNRKYSFAGIADIMLKLRNMLVER